MNMKISDTTGSIHYNKNFIRSAGQVSGFQKKFFIRKEHSDSVSISEDAVRMFRERNSSPLVKTMSKIMQIPAEQVILSEQSWDAMRHSEVEKLSAEIKSGRYDFENSEILDTVSSRILELF